MKQDPSVDAEAHTLLDKGSKVTLITLDLWRAFLLPSFYPIQKLLLFEYDPMKTFPEAAPTQNLSPLWFHFPSMLALVSLNTARFGLYCELDLSKDHTRAPLSVETERS